MDLLSESVYTQQHTFSGSQYQLTISLANQPTGRYFVRVHVPSNSFIEEESYRLIVSVDGVEKTNVQSVATRTFYSFHKFSRKSGKRYNVYYKGPSCHLTAYYSDYGD